MAKDKRLALGPARSYIGCMSIAFDNSFARLPADFHTRLDPTPVAAPRLLAWNGALADALGLGAPQAEIYAGNLVPDGAEPLAQLYAGHQFGNYTPQLGDGRAILLGEVIGQDGQRRDIQLKGAGRTPYSRGGDGRAWLGPVLREYVISEAMHALGIPTTRALAATATGEDIWRETGALPGAVLTRVAASHLRVGHFEVFAHRGETDALRTLTEYAIARHAPQSEGPLGLLTEVCARQAELIAQWMSVGFIHGVMNTDNCTISGETIDYGPCAFMDDFHMGRVFSSIDSQGRYAFGNQPNIAIWNMAQFATALIQQMEDREAAAERATAIIHAMPAQIEAAWTRRFAAKLGISTVQDGDAALAHDLLDLMQKDGADFTNTFRALAEGTAEAQITDRASFAEWAARHRTRIAREPDPHSVMRAANPAVIPRNHRIEQMIDAAVSGDMGPFEHLMQTLATPYADTGSDLARPPAPDEAVRATFCGT